MKIIFELNGTGFYSLQENYKKEAETVGEEMLCAILYLENSSKHRFSDLNKRFENYYVPNKTEYPRTVTAVQSILLNYQPNHNSNRNSQSNGVSNQLMFSQNGKTMDNEGDKK